MIDRSNGKGPSHLHPGAPCQGRHTTTKNAPGARRREAGDNGHRAGSGPARPAKSISVRKREANRRNARQSTGPRTEAGKQASRLNALKHALLAKEVVITRGDYQEDEQEFAQLLDQLVEQFEPVGIAEELEVQKIAFYYWRTMRAIRAEHGAIRQRTGDLQGREDLQREERFDQAVDDAVGLELSSRGIQYLINCLESTKQELRAGKVSSVAQEWLVKYFPNHFVLPDEVTSGGQAADGRVPIGQEYVRELLQATNEQLRRLALLRKKVVRVEELELGSKIRGAALPGSAMLEKLVRYETSNQRELDRALNRLDRMQESRRDTGDTPSET